MAHNPRTSKDKPSTRGNPYYGASPVNTKGLPAHVEIKDTAETPKGVDDLLDMVTPVAEASIEVAMARGGGISTATDVSLSPVGSTLEDHGGDIVMAVIEDELPGSSLVVDVALDAVDNYERVPTKAKKAKKPKPRADIISTAARKATAQPKKRAPKQHPFLSRAESRRR